jgi:hypothetical protein
MKFSIFASKDTGTNSKELKRFDTPEDNNSDFLAAAYVSELAQQGWRINEVCETDSNGFPIKKPWGPARASH